MNETDPYAPPLAPVSDLSMRGATIAQFPRFSAWWVFLLLLVTLSFYMGYWLYTRSRLLERIAPAYRVPPGVVYVAAALFLVNFALGFGQAFLYPADAQKEAFASLFNVFASIVFLVWLFWFRSRLNALLEAEAGGEPRLSAVMTFLFSVIYVQYKVNEAIDAQTATSDEAADATIPGR